MKKIVVKSIFLIIVFCSLLANPHSTRGLKYTCKFSEIGSIEPSISVINLQCIDNELAFVLDINNHLMVYNITEPTNIIELDSVNLYFPHDIELDLDRNLIFVTASNGVNIFDYSNPTDLQLLSVYKNYTHSTFIQLHEKLLFVGAEEYGLQIVNVTDSNTPVLIGNWTDPVGHIGQVYVIDEFIFVATRIPNISGPPTYLDLKVLNISNPLEITYVSTVDTGGTFNGGAPRAHNNNLVYFNDHAYGLKILNFSNPYDVSVVGNFSDGGFYNDVELVDGEIAFLADDYFGLKVVSCHDITNPLLISSWEHQWRTLRVIVQSDRVYLATINGGVRILSQEIITKEVALHPFLIVSSLMITYVLLKFKKKKTLASH